MARSLSLSGAASSLLLPFGRLFASQSAPPWMVSGVRSFKPTTREVPVILIKDFASLGFKGEELTVKPGYARNYLVPRKIVVYATLENRAVHRQERSAEDTKKVEEQKRIASVNKRMSRIKITFKRHCTEGEVLYGSVTARNIVQALAKQEIEIEESKVELPEPIKALGDHVVNITLPSGDIFALNVTVVKR